MKLYLIIRLGRTRSIHKRRRKAIRRSWPEDEVIEWDTTTQDRRRLHPPIIAFPERRTA